MTGADLLALTAGGGAGTLADAAPFLLLTAPLLAAIFRSRRGPSAGAAREGRSAGHGGGNGQGPEAPGPAAPSAEAPGRDRGAGPRLLELLVREGLLSPGQAQTATAEQRRTGERLTSVVTRLGYVAEGDLLDFLSRTYGLPVINLQRLEVPEEVRRLVRREIVLKHGVLPVRQVGHTLTLALSDPTVVLAIDDVQFCTGLHVVPVLAPESALREAIDRYYAGAGASRLDELLRTEGLAPETVEVVERTQTVDITELEERAGKAPVIRLVNLILADAIRKRASDIHLEPFEDVFLVRYRIDGVLQDVMAPPKALEPAILSRVKIMARMDIAERRLPQDGRISVRLGSRQVDLRVSSLPTIAGEKLVLRILDKVGVVLDLEKLGFEEDDLARFRRAIRTPYGMILVTGPTGSGKSTTLYAAVREISSPDVNVLTVEDPVEFNLPRVNQVQVREDIGLGFSATLRAFLRQDPDIILLGEIRDTETAQIAIRAALTGHLVLSTLHTNNAPSSIVRLLDMGIAPFLVSSSLLMVVAQRLCRRICPECREPVSVPLSALLDAGFAPEEAEQVQIYRGAGCAACAQTGYRGRTAIHEILEVTPEIQEAVVQRRPATELAGLARKLGMRTLREAGLRKVARGVTTLEEVARVTYLH
ncbi:MAG: type IV-A pilus assembly ATPase PilB [Armatimonadota bacterium]|nr:type IV-A pilus assembly ATPase PilB [Armatimonadota bacterium]MDR7528743.1 type IV-A pilus assembly ATPase PilB [Armatimonadota bacterium]